jgi:hypothetical protein
MDLTTALTVILSHGAADQGPVQAARRDFQAAGKGNQLRISLGGVRRFAPQTTLSWQGGVLLTIFEMC